MQIEKVQTEMFYTVKFMPSERRVFKKRQGLTVSQWAERYGYISQGAHKGKWRNEITPYIAFILDLWGKPWVRELNMIKAPQTGGTNAMHMCAAWAIDNRPGPMQFVLPSQKLAGKLIQDRITPMIHGTQELKKHISVNPDDMTKDRIKLSNGMLIYMSWANSTTSLSSDAIMYQFLDETGKFPKLVGKEADSSTLAGKRTRTYRNRYKCFRATSPTETNEQTYREFLNSDVIYRHSACCPACKTEQTMNFQQIKWPENADFKSIERENLAWYECIECHDKWTDTQRDKAVRDGKWAGDKEIKKPKKVGVHMPSWLSPDVSLSEIAAAYLKSKLNKSGLIDFYNDYCAEIYLEKYSERKESHILALRDTRPRGLVPLEISCLLLIVDTQKRGFYYEVRAFGWGPDLESWQVREGYVESFKGLEEILYNSEYKDSTGTSHVIMAGFIDSGGGTGTIPTHSRTAEVYDFCRKNKAFRPVKGRQRMTTIVNPSRLDHYPGKKTPIPGGLTLYLINVTYLKNQLAAKLTINPDDPGAWHLHSECTEDYARHMVAEYMDGKGMWQCPRGKANHYWDIAVYAMAAAEILQIKFWKRVEKEVAKDKDEESPKKTGTNKRKRW